VADLDRDGLPEIAAGTQGGKLIVWDARGVELFSVVAPGSPAILGAPSFADIDRDGDLEIFVGTGTTSETGHTVGPTGVAAWHHDGSPVAGWPQPMTQFLRLPGSPTFADVDFDGTPEVIALANDDNLYVWRANGTLLPGWPKPGAGPWLTPGGYEFRISTPSSGDIDGDGDVEIVAETESESLAPHVGRVMAFHDDGTEVAGWPKFIRGWGSSPVIADLDLDGDVEVIVAAVPGVYVWNLTGAFSGASREWPAHRHDNRRTGAYEPRPQVSLLFDTSGSMDRRFDGERTADPAQRKISLARQAALPFLDLLNDFGAWRMEFGIAVFPRTATSCAARTIEPMRIVNDANIDHARTTAIPVLTPSGQTPLLNGVEEARQMLRPGIRSAIVLLSDGYHNCPSPASVGDPAVTELLARLNAHGTRVFSIGFGLPADIDHPLLETLASRTTPPAFTGSQFYDVTTPAFDPATWDPATALQAIYKSILIDALGLDGVIDPLDTIAGGRSRSFDVAITEHDHIVSFYLSWKTLDSNRLQMTIRSSDGAVVPIAGPGIRLHRGETYVILTVNREFLSLPGKVGARSWTFEVSTAGKVSEPFQYSVIVDSALQMRSSLGRLSPRAGEPLLLTLDLTERGTPLPGAKAFVTASLPFTDKPEMISLFDNGTHGDGVPNDGVYSATFTKTTTPGIYSFRFHAEGKTPTGSKFTRERVTQTFIPLPGLGDNPNP
jgi:hypothetical protein